jgi:hypothetical protein
MKFFIPILFALMSLSLSAQEYTREQMEEILGKQEALVDGLVNDFFTLNEQIETKIQNVIETLASYEDSSETKTRVSNLKSKVLDELKDDIRALQQRRNANAAMLARLPSNYAEGDGATRANKFLDEKISTRVDQVMEMANSLYQSKDVKKYDYVVRHDYDDNLKVRKKKSDEWKEDRKQSINSNQDREKLIQEIEAAQNRLQQEINHIKAEQQSAGGGPLPPAVAQQLADKEELVATLAEKKKEVFEGKTVATQAVGTTKGAMELERQVSMAMDDLRMANNELRQKGQELQQALLRLDAQQAKLAEFDAKAE